MGIIMNKTAICIFAGFATFCLPACEPGIIKPRLRSESNTTESGSYEQSYRKWIADKQAHHNSYQYVISFSSWAGFGESTTIIVYEGRVTGRKYESWKYTSSGSAEKEITAQWTEDSNTLNSHAEGAPVQTLDQIYQQCSGNWLAVDPAHHTIYAEYKNDGLLSLCGYVPKNCADDCFTGVRITDFNWL